MLGKKKIAVISLLLAYTVAVPVFAYFVYQTEPTYITSGVVLQSYPTPNMTLGFYLDENCTQPVSNFDFGEMITPQFTIYMKRKIYIRNEGDVWHQVFWNSTLYSVTTEIQESWTAHNGSWNANPMVFGVKIDPGQVRETWYWIRILPYTTVGTYNWTLTAWGEHYY